jgi:acetyl esterase/lipase
VSIFFRGDAPMAATVAAWCRWVDATLVVPSGVDDVIMRAVSRCVPPIVTHRVLTAFVKFLALIFAALPFLGAPAHSPELKAIILVLTLCRHVVVLTLRRARNSWDKVAYLYPPLPGIRSEEVSIDGMEGYHLRLTEAPNPGLLLWFYGGAFIAGGARGTVGFVGQIAADSGCDALLPHHRQSPEFTLADMLEDALRAYRWALRRYPSRCIVIGGQSSGGFLAALLCARLSRHSLPPPAGLVLVSAVLDLTGTTASVQHTTDCFMGKAMVDFVHGFLPSIVPDGRPENWSPLNHSVRGFPPTFVCYGDAECCVDENTAFVAKCCGAGVEVVEAIGRGLFHTYLLFHCWCPEAVPSYCRLTAFTRDVLTRPLPGGRTDPIADPR